MLLLLLAIASILRFVVEQGALHKLSTYSIDALDILSTYLELHRRRFPRDNETKVFDGVESVVHEFTDEFPGNEIMELDTFTFRQGNNSILVSIECNSEVSLLFSAFTDTKWLPGRPCGAATFCHNFTCGEEQRIFFEEIGSVMRQYTLFLGLCSPPSTSNSSHDSSRALEVETRRHRWAYSMGPLLKTLKFLSHFFKPSSRSLVSLRRSKMKSFRFWLKTLQSNGVFNVSNEHSLDLIVFAAGMCAWALALVFLSIHRMIDWLEGSASGGGGNAGRQRAEYCTAFAAVQLLSHSLGTLYLWLYSRQLRTPSLALWASACAVAAELAVYLLHVPPAHFRAKSVPFVLVAFPVFISLLVR